MKLRQVTAVASAIKKLRISATDEQALSAVYIYPEWKADSVYAAGDRVRYGDTLYKCLIPHTAQETWTPANAASLWAKVLIPAADVIPDWEQPSSTNPYMTGNKVMYRGYAWISTIDNNVWEPSVYGWVKM